MPVYSTNPFGAPPETLQPGQPGYAFGSFNANAPTTKMIVSKTASTGGTATVTVQVVEGNIPIVGALITIRGTSQGAGVFNVTNASITAVSITATTGQGTIQFALAGTVASSGDAGIALVPTPEVGEFLAVQASKAFAVPYATGFNDNERSITWQLNYPSAPAVVSVSLQGSLEDVDSLYSTIDTSTNVNGEERVTTLSNFRFLRLKVTQASGGTNATIVGRIFV